MKITIEAEDGDGDVEMYPLVLERVFEFTLVGTQLHALGHGQPVYHTRCGANTWPLRGQLLGIVEYLRDRAHVATGH